MSVVDYGQYLLGRYIDVQLTFNIRVQNPGALLVEKLV